MNFPKPGILTDHLKIESPIYISVPSYNHEIQVEEYNYQTDNWSEFDTFEGFNLSDGFTGDSGDSGDSFGTEHDADGLPVDAEYFASQRRMDARREQRRYARLNANEKRRERVALDTFISEISEANYDIDPVIEAIRIHPSGETYNNYLNRIKTIMESRQQAYQEKSADFEKILQSQSHSTGLTIEQLRNSYQNS